MPDSLHITPANSPEAQAEAEEFARKIGYKLDGRYPLSLVKSGDTILAVLETTGSVPIISTGWDPSVDARTLLAAADKVKQETLNRHGEVLALVTPGCPVASLLESALGFECRDVKLFRSRANHV